MVEEGLGFKPVLLENVEQALTYKKRRYSWVVYNVHSSHWQRHAEMMDDSTEFRSLELEGTARLKIVSIPPGLGLPEWFRGGKILVPGYTVLGVQLAGKGEKKPRLVQELLLPAKGADEVRTYRYLEDLKPVIERRPAREEDLEAFNGFLFRGSFYDIGGRVWLQRQQ